MWLHGGPADPDLDRSGFGPARYRRTGHLDRHALTGGTVVVWNRRERGGTTVSADGTTLNTTLTITTDAGRRRERHGDDTTAVEPPAQ